MGSFGGWSFAGGTATFGGDADAEKRWTDLLIRCLGDKAYDKEMESVRSRFLFSFAIGLAAMESEALKTQAESVPCNAIDALDDWEKVHGVDFVANVFRTYLRRQNFEKGIMQMALSMAHRLRIQARVRAIMEDDECYVYENTGATIDSVDGVRYWCVLVPDKYAGAEYRTLWRVLEGALARWAPAHTEFTICTVDDGGGPPPVPLFYLDGYGGTACGKDCPGA